MISRSENIMGGGGQIDPPMIFNLEKNHVELG